MEENWLLNITLWPLMWLSRCVHTSRVYVNINYLLCHSSNYFGRQGIFRKLEFTVRVGLFGQKASDVGIHVTSSGDKA